MKHLFLDFEFRNLVGPKRDLVCVSWAEGKEAPISSLWLEEKANRQIFAEKTFQLAGQGTIFVGYTEAEPYCLLQIWEEFNLSPKDFKYCDLYLEYRMLLNYNFELSYGKQLIKGEIVSTTPPPNKWNHSEEEKVKEQSHHKPLHSLSAACYKLLGVIRDTEHKDKMRDLIISGEELTDKDREDILKYCEEDVRDLPKLTTEIGKRLYHLSKERNIERLRREILLRGDYSIRTAKMIRLGYPIDEAKLRKFSDSTGLILRHTQEELNRDYPDICPFQWNEKSKTYIQKRDRLNQWIERTHKDWPVTPTGQYKLDLESFRQYYSSQSPGFGGAFNRYLYLKQSLYGFMPRTIHTKTPSFWEALGGDKRIHPSFGIYGSSTARSQPKAFSYLLLKSNWMRAFIRPPKGRAIVTIDYGSQEFLISALLSEDENMIKAYESSDPYLYFAKLDGAIPKHGTKESHSEERNLYKTIVLGMSYLMGPSGLRKKLSQDTGKEYSEDQANGLIEAFRQAFPDFSNWQKNYIEEYYSKGRNSRLKLPCGWYLWGDTPKHKFRTIGNHAIQGFGSSILRKAVSIAQDKGLDVILTLHDAIYVEYNAFDFSAIDALYEAMDEAFKFYFKSRIKRRANCRMDIFTFSDEYSKDISSTPKDRKFKTNNIYLDKKGENEYFKYLSLLENI